MISDIMTVSRLRMGTDGKGVSTLVTFFDCPLHCKYCINDICHDIEFGEVPRAIYTPEELIRTLEKDDIYLIECPVVVLFLEEESLFFSHHLYMKFAKSCLLPGKGG